MKRLAMVVAAVAGLAIGSVAVAFAQTPTPGAPGQGGWSGCGGWGGPGAGGNYDPANNPTLKRLADKLGIGAADLAKDLQAGKSVAEVAKARNVDAAALVEVLVAPQAEMMKLGIKYGYMTQEQVDAMLKFMADRAKSQLEQQGFFGGGMMGGFGGGMMGGFGGGMMGGFGGGMMGPGMMGGFGGTMGPGMMGRGSGPGFRGSSY